MAKFLPSKWANDHNIFFSISGSRLNFKNRFDYFTQNVKRMCHEKFQTPVKFN
jgi:hypothetical protein